MKPISVEEWKAFTTWLLQNNQPLPKLMFTGQIDPNDAQYLAFVGAGAPGYTAPPAPKAPSKYSREWWNQYNQQGLKQFQWSPAGGTVAPTVPAVAPTAPGRIPYQWYEPGQVLLDPNTGKLYFTGGDFQIPQSNIEEMYSEISRQDAQSIRTTKEQARQSFGKTGNAQMDFLLLQSREAEKERAWSSAQQRFAAKDVGLQSQNRELQRQINEMQFERDRQDFINATPSNDWIRLYHLQNMPNRYAKPDVSPIDELEANLDTLSGTIQKYEAEEVFAANAEAKGERYHITSAEANEVVSNLKENRTALEGIWKTVQEESRDWSPQPVPQPYPETPGWLPQYVPGLQAGQMITRQNVPTPSGQQLTAMSRDQLEQLGYYGKWAGGLTGKYPWEQLTEAANLMQPRTPGGAGRFGWTPSRQV